MNQKNIILRQLFDYHISKSREGKTNAYLQYLYRSRNHYMINLLIASYVFEGKEKGIAYEEICRLLDHQFASRTTILHILDQGVADNFLSKVIDSSDQRKQNYSLNPIAEKIIADWLDNHPFNIEKIN